MGLCSLEERNDVALATGGYWLIVPGEGVSDCSMAHWMFARTPRTGLFLTLWLIWVQCVAGPQTRVSGLDVRPQNRTCLAPPRPVEQIDLSLQHVHTGLVFAQPVGLLQAPNDSSRWFVLEKAGRLIVFDDTLGTTSKSVFLDIRDRVDSSFGESGLLGMAFHPEFASNGFVFVSYTSSGNPLQSRVSRFRSMDGGLTVDSASEQVLLAVDQPFANHNGGWIGFGPDGLLHIGLGDGGSGGDPLGHGQNTDSLLGSVLRIDVDGPAPYGIPADNPFVGGAGGRPEIYAWGVRNPWRWSFDQSTGTLWAGDVGQQSWEEIDIVERGGNYGWNRREGAHCYGAPECDGAGLIDPITEYAHSQGCSVTGGYVYRGGAIPALDGVYVWGDYCSGRVWGLEYDEQGNPSPTVLLDSGHLISSFGQGHDGEIYLLAFAAGEIYKLVSTAAAPARADFPQTLSETGCVDPFDPRQPAPGVIPYAINSPFWSDGAQKWRGLAVPDGHAIHVDASGAWQFPIGSVLIKTFALGGTPIETRLLVRHADGDWAGYSYQWRNDGSEADLVVGGRTRDIDGQRWIYPSSAACLQCHTSAAGRTLGLETAQMNREFTYSATGRTANQLLTYAAIGMFDGPLPDLPANLPVLPSPDDRSQGVHERARAWLHANCSNCHRPQGPVSTDFDLRFATEFSDMAICDRVPQGGALGVTNPRVFAPGSVHRSMLWLRASRRDAHGMPPLGTALTDPLGLSLVSDWISTIADCECAQRPLSVQDLDLSDGQSARHTSACSIIAGSGVIVRDGAELMLRAPVVLIEPGIVIERGGAMSVSSGLP